MTCLYFTLWGNPTSYRGATLTWEGRTLTFYEDDEISAEYEYDENGMRYRTTVTSKTDGLLGSYEYVWVDGKLISIVYVSGGSTETAKYLYNDNDEPIGMVVTDAAGSLSTYYYLKNMQGDITHIISPNGKKLVDFTYDVFGKQTVHYQSNGSTIIGMIELAEQVMACALTPFGYRGYCYDMYTGLYYLQSRYYDPETGRFINADDTNYLNVTGTVLGCNLFAYCENDPVNYTDATGTWAEDVHRGYFTKNIDGTNYIGGIYKYSNVKGVYMPYYTSNGNRIYYGTYLWAIQCGIKPDYAKRIADACIAVDDIKKGKSWMPYIGDQSWHFNIYWGEKKVDSRIINSNSMITKAKYCFETNNINSGLVYLGMALHPIQDIFAHTSDVCFTIKTSETIYDAFGAVIGYKIIDTGIWMHSPFGNADNARVRTNQLRHAAIQSKKILEEFSSKYSFLCY